MRVIDISGQATVNRDGVGAGTVPELRWLPISDLVIDDQFQRPLGKPHAVIMQRWHRLRVA